jgi:hypothetical protein
VAGPTTEVLNDDIKELKVEIKEIKAEIKEIKADLRRGDDEIKADLRRGDDLLRQDFHKIAVGLAELNGEAKVYLGVAKWAVAFVVTTALTSGVAGIWWASSVNAKVEGLRSEIHEKTGTISSRIDKIEASINKI